MPLLVVIEMLSRCPQRDRKAIGNAGSIAPWCELFPTARSGSGWNRSGCGGRSRAPNRASHAKFSHKRSRHRKLAAAQFRELRSIAAEFGFTAPLLMSSAARDRYLSIGLETGEELRAHEHEQLRADGPSLVSADQSAHACPAACTPRRSPRDSQR